MVIAIALFDALTALDAIGPYQVLAKLPGADVRFCAAEPGTVRTDDGVLALTADHAFADVPAPDIVLVPGGRGTREGDRSALLDWLRDAHETSTWTTSVCTGALLLGAAGLLEGKRATTHWLFFDHLRATGAEPVSERYVEDGTIITAAGVSAGIDMALALAARIAGDETAQAIQLGIEYDPQPPFDAGSVATAPTDIVAAMRAVRDLIVDGGTS